MTNALALFPDQHHESPGTTSSMPVALGENDYYPTQAWLAARILEQRFGDLSAADHVLDPGCGNGHFLDALRERDVPATGIEINPTLATIAREHGHNVILGDFTTVPFPAGVTAAVGNPPFSMDLIDALLARLARAFTSGSRAGFVLPAYFFQTSSHVQTLRADWSIAVDLIPRNVFPRLSMPLTFSLFTRNHKRAIWGLTFYDEVQDVLSMHAQARVTLGRGAWRELVLEALLVHGGTATLDQLYAYAQPRRPSGNPWWSEQIRKVAAKVAVRTAPGTYTLATLPA